MAADYKLFSINGDHSFQGLKEFEYIWTTKIPVESARGGDSWHMGATPNTLFEWVMSVSYAIRLDSAMQISQLANNSLFRNSQYFTAPVDLANVLRDGKNIIQQMQPASVARALATIEPIQRLDKAIVLRPMVGYESLEMRLDQNSTVRIEIMTTSIVLLHPDDIIGQVKMQPDATAKGVAAECPAHTTHLLQKSITRLLHDASEMWTREDDGHYTLLRYSKAGQQKTYRLQEQKMIDPRVIQFEHSVKNGFSISLIDGLAEPTNVAQSATKIALKDMACEWAMISFVVASHDEISKCPLEKIAPLNTHRVSQSSDGRSQRKLVIRPESGPQLRKAVKDI